MVVGASGFDGHARRRSPSSPPLLVDHRYLGRYREADLSISVLSCAKYTHGIISFVYSCFLGLGRRFHQGCSSARMAIQIVPCLRSEKQFTLPINQVLESFIAQRIF